MALASPFGAHPELFGPLYLLAFLSAYVVSAVVGYRRGWPPAAWLLVLAAAGIGGVAGTRLLPMAAELLMDGALAEGTTRRLPGTILGALAAAELARRALGIRLSVLDPLVPGGLVALIVARLGCLAAGCCFGTPTDLPWGATYADGSIVHGFHLFHGLAENGATVAVHPVPFYDIAFALVGLALLPWASRRLQAAGTLCGVAVAAYAGHRVVQEFVRADAVPAVGALTAMQVGMAVVGLAALVAVVVAERRARGRDAVAIGGEPTAGRLVAALAVLVGTWAALGGWLTPGEGAVLLVRLVPAAVAVGFVVRRSAAAPRVRWSAAALAAGLPLVVGFQAEAATQSFDVFFVEGHAAQGRYEDSDVCSTTLYDYQKGGAAFGVTRVDVAREVTREFGVRAFAASQTRTLAEPGDESQSAFSVQPYWQYEGRNGGVSVGALAGEVVLGTGTRTTSVFPTFGFRLGPRNAHLQGGLADASLFGPPAGSIHLGAGTGRLTASGQELRIQGGILDNGLYLSGTIPASEHVLVEPMGAMVPGRGEGLTLYQVGARVRVQLPAN